MSSTTVLRSHFWPRSSVQTILTKRYLYRPIGSTFECLHAAERFQQCTKSVLPHMSTCTVISYGLVSNTGQLDLNNNHFDNFRSVDGLTDPKVVFFVLSLKLCRRNDGNRIELLEHTHFTTLRADVRNSFALATGDPFQRNSILSALLTCVR